MKTMKRFLLAASFSLALALTFTACSDDDGDDDDGGSKTPSSSSKQVDCTDNAPIGKWVRGDNSLVFTESEFTWIRGSETFTGTWEYEKEGVINISYMEPGNVLPTTNRFSFNATCKSWGQDMNVSGADYHFVKE